MFDMLSRSDQGDLGEARAVYELTRLGYKISKPLHVHLPYDFIADKNGTLFRVQVKTSNFILRESTQCYQVQLATAGGNRTINTRKHFDTNQIDLLFVLTGDDRCWLIPANSITSKNVLNVGTTQYEQYQISGTVISRSAKDSIPKPDGRVKEPPFSRDELQSLLWKIPTTDIGKKFNMSDNGITRWAKKWNLTKPPRGYWQSQP